MIHPRALLRAVIEPALSLLPPNMRGPEACAMLLAIALQESGLRHRAQVGGPARGLWQFEIGGVRGVLDHPASWDHAQDWCEAWLYPIHRDQDGHVLTTTVEQAHRQLRDNDLMACVFARLALWRLPDALVEEGRIEAAWGQYIEAWGPGKPHRNRFDDNWSTAWAAVDAA